MPFRNAPMRRRKRHPVAPSLEALEGRQLLAVGAMRVRVQEAVVKGVAQLVVQGSRRADLIQITDNGSSAAGNISVTLQNGETYTSKRAIRSIVVRGGLGRDEVRYDLTGDVTGERDTVIALGGGADRFTGAIHGTIATSGALNLQAFGEAGNDHLEVVQTGATRSGIFFPYLEGNGGNDSLSFKSASLISAGATVGPALLGGAGNDWVAAEYAGQVSGQYLYNNTLEGGLGNDNLSNVVSAHAGSWGKIGASSTTRALVTGGEGNDHILYAINVDPSGSVLEVNASLTGGGGTDTVRRTASVVIDTTVEDDGVIA